MRIAYLIYAHTHPELLARTVRVLDTQDVCFFIHIDKKVDIKQFQRCLPSSDNVIFIRKRIRVFWMGYSIVKATLALMEAAVEYADRTNRPFTYHILLSGTDYPIKSNREIREFLESSNNTEYILFWKLTDRPVWLHKIERYHYLDSYLTNQRSAPKAFRRLYEIAHRSVHRVLPKRRYLQNLVPYGGATWWMLTDRAVRYILTYEKNNREFVRFYKLTHSPDEMVFQTILLNSAFAESMSNYAVYMQWSNRSDKSLANMPNDYEFNYRYIDWNQDREKPAILDENDLESLKASGCLFARKFDPIKSKMLLDHIDRELR